MQIQISSPVIGAVLVKGTKGKIIVDITQKSWLETGSSVQVFINDAQGNTIFRATQRDFSPSIDFDLTWPEVNGDYVITAKANSPIGTELSLTTKKISIKD